MKYTYGKCSFALLVAIITYFGGAESTAAYFTTHQSATKLNDTTALFTVEYGLGRKKDTVYMPILGTHNGTQSTTSVSYTILDQHGKPVPGKATGMVFSRAPMTLNGMYTTGPDVVGMYTLAVFFTPEKPTKDTAYKLQVTYLPFNYNGTTPQHLNPSELKYYVTPEVQL